MYTRISGQYRRPSSLLINAAGSWKRVKSGWVNVSGTWRRFYYDWLSMLLTGTAGSGSGNKYHYEDFSTQSVTIASGDKLMYDIYPVNTLDISVDARYTGISDSYGVLRANPNIKDQNGVQIHAASSPTAQPTVGKWYHREFDLSSLAGGNIAEWCAVLETDAAGTYQMYLRDVKIVAANGTIKAQLMGDTLNTPALKTFQSNTSNGYSKISKSMVTGPL